VDTYEIRLRKHVLPQIGSMKADDVRVQHIRRLIDGYKAQGQAGGSIHRIVSTISAVFRHGVVNLGLGRNPCRDLERGELPSPQRLTEPRYLTFAEVERLLAELSDESRPIGATLFWAAARVSECLSLRWQHIDFEQQRITIPGTKTMSSAATIRLMPALATELRAHRARQAALGFDRVKPDALIFQTASGQPPSRQNVTRAVNSASKRAGLVAEGQEVVGAHDLRHSLASCARGLGLTLDEVSKMLRHKNPQVTATVYSAWAEGQALTAGDKFAAGLGGA
jgi:integrase